MAGTDERRRSMRFFTPVTRLGAARGQRVWLALGLVALSSACGGWLRRRRRRLPRPARSAVPSAACPPGFADLARPRGRQCVGQRQRDVPLSDATVDGGGLPGHPGQSAERAVLRGQRGQRHGGFGRCHERAAELHLGPGRVAHRGGDELDGSRRSHIGRHRCGRRGQGLLRKLPRQGDNSAGETSWPPDPIDFGAARAAGEASTAQTTAAPTALPQRICPMARPPPTDRRQCTRAVASLQWTFREPSWARDDARGGRRRRDGLR